VIVTGSFSAPQPPHVSASMTAAAVPAINRLYAFIVSSFSPDSM